jgi:hypothetical protein
MQKDISNQRHANLRETTDKIALNDSLEIALIQRFSDSEYSRLLKKIGSFPTPSQASALGLLHGVRYKADDGKLYPTKTISEVAHDAGARERRRAFKQRFIAMENLSAALSAVARIDLSTVEVEMISTFRDMALRQRPEVLACLNRFALKEIINVSNQGTTNATHITSNCWIGALQAANDR